MGHYAARGDLQQTFELNKESGIKLIGQEMPCGHSTLSWNGPEICEHFGISVTDATSLFRDSDYDDDYEREIPCGCDGATTATEAAEYIENFVAAR